jgi:hypothetical protein
MRIVGTVVEEESGKPLAGLQVKGFDKDLIFDDKLGTSVTDEKGQFRIDFSSFNFSLLPNMETVPDVYVRVFDAAGKKLLYTSEKAIRHQHGVEERFDIRISKTKLS